MPNDTMDRLESAMVRVKNFLNSVSVENSVRADLFVDPEDTDWKQIKIIVGAARSLKVIYDEFKPVIRRLVRESLPVEVVEKVLINFETI
jgi:hypothetical protein